MKSFSQLCEEVKIQNIDFKPFNSLDQEQNNLTNIIVMAIMNGKTDLQIDLSSPQLHNHVLLCNACNDTKFKAVVDDLENLIKQNIENGRIYSYWFIFGTNNLSVLQKQIIFKHLINDGWDIEYDNSINLARNSSARWWLPDTFCTSLCSKRFDESGSFFSMAGSKISFTWSS